MKKIIEKIFGTESQKAIKKLKKTVDQINTLEPEIEKLSDEALRAKTDYFKEQLSAGKTLDDILPEAFAVVREVSKRVHNERHYDVQLIGGMVIHQGKIAEMRTGEGKTLVSTLPAYLNALEGRGVHIVTVNDYLARRDTVWMGEIYNFLGISVAVLNSQASFIYDPSHTTVEDDKERDEEGSHKIVYEFLRPTSRVNAYKADITYGTNSEFGFDYLRDNLEYLPQNIRQVRHNFAIVDEIDSILIDEARTPLIISAPSTESDEIYKKFAEIARSLKESEDYEKDEKKHAITLSESGIDKAEKALGIDNIYTEGGTKMVHHLENAVTAKALYNRDDQYVVQNGEVVIVDTFTGRLQPGRRWSNGLHQAVEAKEGVSVQKESRTVASITYQNYFRMYEKLSGMTGTAETSAEEFYKTYGLEVVVIPTNKPIARKDHNDLIFATERGKYTALARKVKELHERGQPVLIGTPSVDKNQVLSIFLENEGIPHQVLNAKNHEREGEIIAEAGKKGQVTVATNMAGRGVDIKLGGSNASPEEEKEILEVGGLFVLGTERHESRRIDDQLRGRTGRQGAVGDTQFYVSGEDSLVRVFAKDTFKNILQRFNFAEDEPIQAGPLSRTIENAQKQIEGLHFDARKNTLDFDDVLNQQRSSVYAKRRELLLADMDKLEEIFNEFVAVHDEVREKAEEQKAKVGREIFLIGFKQLYLQVLDSYWMEHLDAMDYLRSSVNLRAYGQREPIVEYKRDGLAMYKQMLANIDAQVLSQIPVIGQSTVIEQEAEKVKKVFASAQRSSEKSEDGKAQPIQKTAEEKIGRNDFVIIENPATGEKDKIKFKHLHKKMSSGWKLVGKA